MKMYWYTVVVVACLAFSFAYQVVAILALHGTCACDLKLVNIA